MKNEVNRKWLIRACLIAAVLIPAAVVVLAGAGLALKYYRAQTWQPVIATITAEYKLCHVWKTAHRRSRLVEKAQDCDKAQGYADTQNKRYRSRDFSVYEQLHYNLLYTIEGKEYVQVFSDDQFFYKPRIGFVFTILVHPRSPKRISTLLSNEDYVNFRNNLVLWFWVVTLYSIGLAISIVFHRLGK